MRSVWCCWCFAVSAAELVPGDVVATWISQNPFSDEPLAGYCAHPPQQLHTLTSPPSVEEQQALAGAKLVGLQVVMRHGVRAPTSPEKPLTCFSVTNYSMGFDTGITDTKMYATQGFKPNLRMELIYPDATWHGAFGALQREAASQMQSLAQALRQLYEFGTLGIKINTTKFRSDDRDRVVGTVYFLAAALFPDATHVKLHTAAAEFESWNLRPNCPQALKEYEDIRTLNNPEIAPNVSEFAAQWQHVAGTIFHPVGFKDCLMQAACYPQPLPEGFTRDLFQWAMRESVRANVAKWAPYAKTWEVLTAPALFELQDALRLQTADAGPKLYLYGTHDTTMIALMVALGIWDDIWPTYAETIVLEAYRGVEDPSHKFFRLLRRGKPIAMPHCLGGTVCDIDVFLSLGPQHLRDPIKWQARCFHGSVDATFAQLPVGPGWLGAFLMSVVAALASAAAVVYLIGTGRSSRQRVLRHLLSNEE